MLRSRSARLIALPLAFAALFASPSADAFCGFYVAGADQTLYNNATMVVLMREGTRTVLSMQNNYQGPPENFAMVVPVPVVLQKENVKTLPNAIFDKVDKLAAPRLVEYWEEDPCSPDRRFELQAAAAPGKGGPPRPAARAASDLGVTVEAQFEVGEYEIVILSAKDSLGLDTWMRQENYKIPAGSEPLLRPYVQAGSKFFVAKVDAKKVRFNDGMAQLSPLRFHYDSDTFTLPVRLGLINAKGKQDLIVHILARQQRYELANYKNVTIPTNLDVDENARSSFGSFYAALFDRTIEENPGAIVTEYSWDSGTCDPCPGPTLNGPDLATLGADVLSTEGGGAAPPSIAPPPPGNNPFLVPKQPSKPPPPAPPISPRPRFGGFGGFVLTRLHARYGKETLGEDLVFRAAPPIMGGREFMADDSRLETGSRAGGSNNFQGRYAIRHAWRGPIACENPIRGRWGGPPAGVSQAQTQAAQNLAFAPRDGVKLASFVRHDVPEIHLKGAPTQLGVVPWAGALAGSEKAAAKPDAQSLLPAPSATGATPTASGAPPASCVACAVGQNATRPSGVLGALGLALLGLLRRKRSS